MILALVEVAAQAVSTDGRRVRRRISRQQGELGGVQPVRRHAAPAPAQGEDALGLGAAARAMLPRDIGQAQLDGLELAVRRSGSIWMPLTFSARRSISPRVSLRSAIASVSALRAAGSSASALA